MWFWIFDQLKLDRGMALADLDIMFATSAKIFIGWTKTLKVVIPSFHDEHEISDELPPLSGHVA